ncbi:MAG: FKBP-type peptidyl-prolyl cis-trans isomerase [SAR324 cluster bacterium]|nr:FKBP-type peptidyl-prolyl cis-trans isomerase [SAR324 cluster bacterium]
MKIGTAVPPPKTEGVKNKRPQLAIDQVFKTLRSGLKLYVERSGEGPKVEKGSHVMVHYDGWLVEDYSKFDSSRDKRRPFEFELGAGKVIQGWEEGLEGVRAGSKIQLIIPAKMAYGAAGVPSLGIPENADLIFKVEVLKVT